MVYDVGDLGFFSEEAVGITALYNYGTWLVMVTDWCLHDYGGDSWKLNRNKLRVNIFGKE